MRIGIVFFLTACGGGELFALETANALIELGYDVLLVTNSLEALKKCSILMNKPMYKAIEVRVSFEKAPLIGSRFEKTRRLLLCEKVINEARKVSNIVIDTTFNVPSCADITYIHYPMYIGKKEWASSIYSRLVYRKWLSLFNESGVVLANSKWTALRVEKIYGVTPRVLYPPVDVEYFKYSGGEKKKLIATAAKLYPGKRIHRLLGVKIPGYKWVIMGSTGLSTDMRIITLTYYNKLVDIARKTGLHVVLRDQPRSTLRQYLQSAIFYIHPPLPEHFGISVVEAMAAGAVPIVYRDGGAWYDVVSRIDSRLGYRDVYEIPEIVKSIEGEVDELSRKAMEMAGEYSVEVFKRNLVEVVNWVVSKI